MHAFIKENEKIIGPGILLIVWSVVHLALWMHFGVRPLFDSMAFVRAADYLLTYHQLEESHHIFYSIPVSVLAFSRFLSPDTVIPFLAFQCLLSGVALLALYHAASNITGDHRAGFFTGLIYLLWWDNIQWNMAVMSESIFCSSIAVSLWWLSRFNGTYRDHTILVFLNILVMLTRPTGVVIIVGSVVYLFVYHWNVISASVLRMTACFASAALMMVIGASVMSAHWDFTSEYAKGNIITYADVISDQSLSSPMLRLDTAGLDNPPREYPSIKKILYFMFHNPLHFLKASALKMYFLISGFRPYYSFKHNTIAGLWMLFIYGASCVAMLRLRNTKLLFFIIAVAACNTLLVGISSADWDNRFYIPMEPGIAILAGTGLTFILRKKLYRLTYNHQT